MDPYNLTKILTNREKIRELVVIGRDLVVAVVWINETKIREIMAGRNGWDQWMQEKLKRMRSTTVDGD